MSQVQLDPAFLTKYTLGRVIGKGAFAIVYEATEIATGYIFAVKIIDKERVQSQRRDLNISERIRAEVEILSRVRHESVIHLHEVHDTPKMIYLVCEMVNGGELFDRICQRRRYSEAEASKLFRQMVSAIQYLHSIGVVHRDLKPENILLASPNDDTTIKISDFGLSRIVGETGEMSTVCGTTSYMAPEILERKPYDKACDMWSLGVILYILLCGYPPFGGQTPAHLLRSVLGAKYQFHEKFWSPVSAEAKDLVTKLLVPDPNRRYTSEQVFEHPWIKQYAATEIEMQEMPPLPQETIQNFSQFKTQFRSGGFGSSSHISTGDDGLLLDDIDDEDMDDDGDFVGEI